MATIIQFVNFGGRKMAPTVFDVAGFFLSLVDEAAGSLMTHLKLQKLCYYAQAWNLVFNREPLYAEHIEAWVHGPVIPALWNDYRNYGFSAIPRLEGFDAENTFTSDQLETLFAVWEAYGCYDGKYLENLTHQEEPWQMARQGYAPEEACNEVITHESMASYYSSLMGVDG